MLNSDRATNFALWSESTASESSSSRIGENALQGTFRALISDKFDDKEDKIQDNMRTGFQFHWTPMKSYQWHLI